MASLLKALLKSFMNNPAIPRVSRLKQFIAIFALVFATGAWAEDDTTPEKKKCDDEIYTAIEHDLRLADFAEQARQKDEDDGFTIVSEACKTWPYKPELTLVAVIYRDDARYPEPDGVVYEKDLLVAIFDTKKKQIVHSRQWRIQDEYPVVETTENSLDFDTARYQLAEGARAFGLRIKNFAHGPSCPSASLGDQLVLLLPEGRSLHPALSLYLHQAEADKEGCGNNATWNSADLAIGVEPARTNGLHDLRVTANLLRWSPEEPDKKRTAHVIFRYNGKRYEPVGKIPWWLENRNLPPGE
jgi:hypothetical protein